MFFVGFNNNNNKKLPLVNKNNNTHTHSKCIQLVNKPEYLILFFILQMTA